MTLRDGSGRATKQAGKNKQAGSALKQTQLKSRIKT